MRRLYYIVTLLLLWPFALSAQVQKQVEVSKDYTPTVSTAQKLSIIPDMTDTVMMRPDVDYTITPRSFETSLMTENFRPATITYWDYLRSRPLYARAAAGVPLASEADLYLATYNKDRGYAMAYVNHWGDYRARKNLAGEKVTKNTMEMDNRIGGRAGLFVGQRRLEVDLGADHRLRHRYPTTGEKIEFGRADGKIRFGDDFTDLSRWNFNVEAEGSYFLDGVDVGDFNESTVAASASVAKMLGGRHILRINVGYDGAFGYKALKAYKNNIISAGARYGLESNRFEFLLGADYYYDNVAGSSASPHHIFPYLRMSWKDTSEGFVPFVEVDGELRRNDFASLMFVNPYLRGTSAVAEALAEQANETSYNGRIGFGGNLGGGIFAYDLSAELSLADNHLYWYSTGADYGFTDAYQHSLRIDASALLRPVGSFEAKVYAGVYAWEHYAGYYSNRPNFNVGTSLSYTSRKIRAGVTLDYASAIKWMTLGDTLTEDGKPTFTYTRTDGTLTLGVEVEWRINDHWAVYAEGRNLTGSKVYEWLNYYRSTPEGMLGVKFSL